MCAANARNSHDLESGAFIAIEWFSIVFKYEFLLYADFRQIRYSEYS